MALVSILKQAGIFYDLSATSGHRSGHEAAQRQFTSA